MLDRTASIDKMRMIWIRVNEMVEMLKIFVDLECLSWQMTRDEISEAIPYDKVSDIAFVVLFDVVQALLTPDASIERLAGLRTRFGDIPASHM